MKKLILIASLVYLAGCGNNTATTNKPTIDSVKSDSFVGVKSVTPVSVLDTNTKEYFYEYFEVLSKGEKGTIKSHEILHKGDHISLDITDGETETDDVIVEITTEPREVKKH